MCVLSRKVPIRKKSGKLFNDPRKSVCVYDYECTHTHTHIYIYIYIYIYKHLSIYLSIYTGLPPKNNTTHKLFYYCYKIKAKIILIFYPRTSVCVRLCPKVVVFLCTESTSYPEKIEKARIIFINLSQKYMGSVSFWITLYINLYAFT